MLRPASSREREADHNPWWAKKMWKFNVCMIKFVHWKFYWNLCKHYHSSSKLRISRQRLQKLYTLKMYKLRSNIKLITNTWQSLTIFHQSLKTKTNNTLIIVETMINLDISAMVCINSADICDLWQLTYFAYICQNWICFCSISPSTDGGWPVSQSRPTSYYML